MITCTGTQTVIIVLSALSHITSDISHLVYILLNICPNNKPDSRSGYSTYLMCCSLAIIIGTKTDCTKLKSIIIYK